MSELINAQSRSRNFRLQLLATASAVTLLTSMYGIPYAKAEDEGRPTVWLELGGQLEQVQDGQELFAPSFVADIPSKFFSPLSVQKPPRYSIGGEGSVSFAPEGSDWVLSASIRFGRSNGVRQRHQQTPNAHIPVHFTYNGKYEKVNSKYPTSHVKLEDAKSVQRETHAVVDFQAGKDVGLGMFGSQGSSVFSAGVRFAQLTSKSNVSMHAEPDVHYPTAPITNLQGLNAFHNTVIPVFHDFAGTEANQRSFRGVGPSLAWSASAPVAGNLNVGEVTIDWGANAAILLGRQKASGHHQTTVAAYYRKGYGGVFSFVDGFGATSHSTPRTHHAADFNRAHSVVVPNLGGFVGASLKWSAAKIAFGYRADFFFGATDSGIDKRNSATTGFFGPFASVSVGLGG